ncbi:MAG: hypothetical protein ACE5J7_04370 [Candidatus Aenigmatarchaeota archaeon]
MAKGFFVVVEGMDASGKTTAIRNVLDELEDAVYSKGLRSNTLFGKISSLHTSTFTLLAELAYNTKMVVKPELRKGRIVLQDRYYISVLSYDSCIEKPINKLYASMFMPFYKEPDLLVYFTVSAEERYKRLKNTLKNPEHAKLYRNNKLLSRTETYYRKFFNEFHGPKRTIDTTDLSERETARLFYTIIAENL